MNGPVAGVRPPDLVPGTEYEVRFEDCCAEGKFRGRFVEILFPGYQDGSGDEGDFEALVFDTGQIGPDWSGAWSVHPIEQREQQ